MCTYMKYYTHALQKLQKLCRSEFHLILERGMSFPWECVFLCVCVHTKVPLMFQETAGFGEPSASQIKTLRWPSLSF